MIISADARQFYKEMNIGTAKPDKQNLQEVEHHFIGNLSITENYDVGKYEKDVLKLLDHLFTIHECVILCGGSGLFIKAVIEGLDHLPATDPEIRKSLQQKLISNGIESLQIILKEVDPEYYANSDIQNPNRLIRALEVYFASGQPISSFHKQEPVKRNFKSIKICLDLERKELYNRINERTEMMFNSGLLKEAEQLYPYKNLNALQTVGYKELFDFFEDKYDLRIAKELIKQNTRHYAKRQITWFKREEFKWIGASSLDEMLNYVLFNMSDD